MSKRLSEENREERWLRKMKMYEEKIAAKRRRKAEREHRNEPPVEEDVQNEEHLAYEGIIPRPNEPDDVALPANSEMNHITHEMAQAQANAESAVYDRHDFSFDEESMMTETTACTSPNSTELRSLDSVERVAATDDFDPDLLRALGDVEPEPADEESMMTETTACTSPNSTELRSLDSVERVAATDDFDPDLLRALGDVEPEPAEFGEDLQGDVAARFQKILQNGLKKDSKEDLLKKYLFPKNVPLAKSPTLNPEIGAMLAETCKLRDKRLLTKQDQLGKTLSALGKALTGLLKKSPDIPEAIRTLNDAGMLLADSHYTETDTRRSVIIPLIDKSLTDPFKDRKRDSFLFGEKLGDLVKDSRGIKKTGQLIQPSPSASTNLNARGPSSRGARQQRGGQAYPHRAGGSRATTMPPQYQYPYPYPNRRRAAVRLPPPAPHRQPAPQPPPARRPPPPTQRPATSRQA